MSAKVKQVLENMQKLTSDEKALVAHCLISSLETKQDDNVEEAWVTLAEARFSELAAGEVQGVTWETIKKDLKS